eukprot:CAMPEP_0202853014 /NCGR_PEP_ID=MMETSP1389-20130828/90265_1 /ASSEMBLY_ACC=CAM_ASM_000865 /TAXON_ID=302021 /ORGANISM="Rhodomonas sp., Strain CCMP768" /LENGTH=208 /DNA_ID=CAMNT_0049531553 /DNA_START=7 /DNA_END=634 /DNA_ORIENTATION=+
MSDAFCPSLSAPAVGARPHGFSSMRLRPQFRIPALRMVDSDWYKMEKMEDLDGGAAKYQFTVDVDGQMSKDSYIAIMKDFKKNAQFPGFRKGTIPPFMIPKVKSFVILDCLEKTLGEAVREQGMELADEEKKPTLSDEQVSTLTKEFQEADGFQYTIEAELKPIEEEADAEESAAAKLEFARKTACLAWRSELKPIEEEADAEESAAA